MQNMQKVKKSIVAILNMTVLSLSVFAGDSQPVSPISDSIQSANYKNTSPEPKAEPSKNSINNQRNSPVFDESRLSFKQRLFLERKKQIEIEYSDSSKTSREGKVEKLKKDILGN